ncbi:MAG: putative DNA binding domain-containing protein [bacterium]|nr:putative DNA binding domain-containing protein [bacterium]MXZ30298.1 transcriptional regulator [Acidimicrobiia bacterium]MDE0667843.1 putative DNA binding domain-containing protein [bacterium]MYB24592.1 transcriptional regulator [Acidimicrobiia bacterium]MYE66702.1 transcriptional regulator [Acidimicrobiia bacterium]
MRSPTDGELAELLAAGESERVEFKRSLSTGTSNTIREAVCAFANDLAGHGLPGVLFVGVGDDGTTTGVPVSDELLRQLADIKTDGNIVPPPSLTVRRFAAAGDVAVVIVLPSDSPPVRYKGRIHVRIGPRRGVATAQDERILNERRRRGDAPFDVQAVPSATIDGLDLGVFVREYLPRAFAREILDANDRSSEEQLAATKMIAGADCPTATVLGLLVLGRNPQDYLPGAYVQFLRFAGTEAHDDIVDAADVRGSLADVLRGVDEKLKAHNHTVVDLTSGPTERRSSHYPLAALQQLIRNAVMHRTYEATNAPVHCRWFSDRIEIISPGGPFGQVTVENFAKAGAVDYRNPNLAEALATLGFVQRFGVGISIAQRLLAEAGHPPASFAVDPTSVLVTVAPAESRRSF